jgi:hypothetical protein
MNERIQELLKQSTTVEYGMDNGFDRTTVDTEKFAELLLKDCVSNVKVWEKDSRNHISYMLKNHYNIEV